MIHRSVNALVMCSVLLLSMGCSSMLPKKYTVTHSQWGNYEELATIIDHIHAGQTLDDLKLLGIDVKNTKNIEYLSHLDIAKRFGLIGYKDAVVKTPEGVKRMLNAAERGRGYELTVENTSNIREGGFWKDFLHFKRVSRTTGWKFSILIITVDDKVEYVLHKGNPNINKVTVEKNPLGPFQTFNGYVVVDLLEDVVK